MTLIRLVAIILICSATVGGNVENDVCDLPKELLDEIRSYRPTVERIVNEVTKGNLRGKTYKSLADFVDKFGPRPAGTKNLENSIDYMLNLLEMEQLDNVHGEEVVVPHWERKGESCLLIEPRQTKIDVLALGSSISTPEQGITAEVLVVRSFAELQRFSAKARGRIVVFNQKFTTYRATAKYRLQGAVQAAKHGAVASLIRSVTPFSLYTLHTGQQQYDTNVTKIPAATITVEDANMLQRYQDRGERIMLKLNIQTKKYADAVSRNVIAEVRGSQRPEKTVLVSGHIDSWDVGVGALDDGGGAFITWNALSIIKTLRLNPKRTVRAVLWTAEEIGLVGAQAYNKAHEHELDNFTFVMEADATAFRPLGLEYNTGTKGGCILKEIMQLLSSINATEAKYNGDGIVSDISIWNGKIPTAGLLNADQNSYLYHHSKADTMDALDSDALDKSTALWASVAYVVADLSEEFPRDFNNVN